jgi:hypothetical protein
VDINGCLAEQLNPDSSPRSVLNMVGASLLVEHLHAEAPDLQLYGAPLASHEPH